MSTQPVPISSEYITLDAFLKYVGAAQTGGHAKTLISEGAVNVNGQPEFRRGRKLRPGDQIELSDTGHWTITLLPQQEEG